MSDIDRARMPDRDLDLELDRAIEALNDERRPVAPAAGPDSYWAALEAAMLVRSLRPPGEPEAEFADRVTSRLADTVAARSPNGHMSYTPVALPSAHGNRRLQAALVAMIETTGAYALAGMMAGVVVGGVGSRIAMRVSAEMYAREHPNFIIRTESSGNLVGHFSWSGTFDLLGQATVLGLISGLFYLVARRWLPKSARTAGLLFGILLLLIAGATVFSADNHDFTRIGSPVLNVAMFGSIFVIFGLAVAPLTRGILRLASGHQSSGVRRVLGRWVLGGLGVLGLVVMVGIVVVGLVELGQAARRVAAGGISPRSAAVVVAIVALTVVLPVSRAILAGIDSRVLPQSRRGAPLADWIGAAALGIALLLGAAVTLAELAGILGLI